MNGPTTASLAVLAAKWAPSSNESSISSGEVRFLLANRSLVRRRSQTRKLCALCWTLRLSSTQAHSYRPKDVGMHSSLIALIREALSIIDIIVIF